MLTKHRGWSWALTVPITEMKKDERIAIMKTLSVPFPTIENATKKLQNGFGVY